MNTLAIIPARAGSKGVKNKNIRLIDNIPLIGYSIHASQQSKLLTHALVSTDDEAIASIARTYGTEVQMRPAYLAQDDTPIVPVVRYVLEELKKNGLEYEIIVLLQPTSPLRSGRDIDSVIEMFYEPGVDGVISVVPMDDIHPARMYSLESDLQMIPLDRENEFTRRQELKPVYYRNGCIYAVRTKTFLSENSLMVKNKRAYVMPYEWMLNIDHERDLLLAEPLVKLWKMERK